MTGDPGYGDASEEEVSLWLYRTEGERRYDRRLKALLRNSPCDYDMETTLESRFLCQNARFLRNFRFLSHGRASKGVRDEYSLHNDRVRKKAQFTENHGIL